MIALKMRFSILHRQGVLIFSTLVLIIIVGSINIIPLPLYLRIVLVFFPYIYITLHFDLWFSTWGRVCILSTTLLIVASLVYPNRAPVTLFLVHILFLVFLFGMMFFYDKHQQQQQQLIRQHHIKTMRVMLRQSLPLTHTVDYSSEAVIILDNNGIIIDSSPQSSLLLSLSESFLVGQPVSDVLCILPNYDPNNSPEYGEFIWKTQTKTEKHIYFRTRPILENDIPVGKILLLFDISEDVKRSETNAQAAKFSVINEVSAGLAHEIRNPLTTIKGFMQLIRPEQWPESYRPYQQLILDEIESIDQVLNRFVLSTSPSAPQMQQLDLIETIHSTVHLIQPFRRRQDVTLILELSSPSEYVMGDSEQLLKALSSLLNNAIEASPKEGKVIIRLSRCESHARISVIDEGPGIPENLRHRVLDPFFTTHSDCTGLGLTIAQQIILAHHGKLHFSESIRTCGTEAMIDLPSLSTFTNTLSA